MPHCSLTRINQQQYLIKLQWLHHVTAYYLLQTPVNLDLIYLMKTTQVNIVSGHTTLLLIHTLLTWTHMC